MFEKKIKTKENAQSAAGPGLDDNISVTAGRSTTTTTTTTATTSTQNTTTTMTTITIAETNTTETTTATTTLSNINLSTNLSSFNTTATKKELKSPFQLKPILKVHEASRTPIIQVQPKPKPKLKLQLQTRARDDKHEENDVVNDVGVEVESVPILPKKTAPKSPQNVNYVPVYSNKLVSSSSSSNYENVEYGAKDEGEDEEEGEIEGNEVRETTINDAEETPMLMQLKLYKEQQHQQQQQQQQQQQHSEEDLTPTAEEKPGLGEKEAEKVENDEDVNGNDDDNDEDDDESTACEEYTDDDIDEALAQDDNDTEDGNVDGKLDAGNENADMANVNLPSEKVMQQLYVNEPITPTDQQQQLDESHYLPMTPKKVELGQQGTLSLVASQDAYDEKEEEENHYVEMTKGLDEEDDNRGNYEIMCISQSLKLTNSEPVYMELAAAAVAAAAEEAHCSSGRSTLKKSKKCASETLKKKSKKRQGKDMPDILKPTKNTLASDSSDADDESGKQHLDAKRLRSRTRFSLSDTFRPASYYLGASTPLNNYAESSDSEILPPPPIPDSPPPMEELKTEEIFSSEHYDTVKRRSDSKVNLSFEQLPKMHASNTSLNLPKTEPSTTLKSSRLSLPDHFAKVRGTPEQQQRRTGAVGAGLALLQQQHARTLSDSNYSCHTDKSSSRTSSSDLELYRKLRCPSNNSLPSESESVEFRQRSDSELERQRSRRPLSQESICEIESMSAHFEETLSSHELDTYLSHLQSSDLLPYQTHATPTRQLLHDVTPTDILHSVIKPPKTFRNADNDEQHFYGNIHFLSSTDSIQQLAEGAAAHLTPLHSRNNSNISTQSAPYYYSELPAAPPLNNQRDIHAHGLNIAHIHNPIDRLQFNMDALVNKDQTIDSKNLYSVKANIEKLSYSCNKLKLNNTMLEQVGPSPEISDVEHSLNQTHSYLTTSSITKNTNLARKLLTTTGGSLVDDDVVGVGAVDLDLDLDKRTTTQAEARATTTNNTNQLSVLGGELLWEEDALWRESLRRVSQRHARSLDDLDRIAVGATTNLLIPTPATPIIMPTSQATKTKLSREVTYVNDCQKPRLLSAASPSPASDEHDVYVQLLANNNTAQSEADVYEVLREEETGSNLSHKSNELDRENIRQWDAMSSGLMKSNNNSSEVPARGPSSSGPMLPLTSNVRSIIQQLNDSNNELNVNANNNNPSIVKRHETIEANTHKRM